MIVITGATGHTGRAAAEALLAKGEKVRVVGRDASKLQEFVQKGAEAAVANIEDKASLAKAFEGATAVYAMIPENLTVEDYRGYQERVGDAIASALMQAQVPYAVTLSSVGAQHAEGTGPIAGLHGLEQKLNRLRGLNVLHVRADFFMENLLRNIPPMRTFGMLPGGLPGEQPLGWTATKDIGAYAAGRLAECDFADTSTQEITGPRDISMKEAASIVGQAIGKPNLGYMQVPFLMLEPALVQMGIAKKTAALVIEMWKGAKAGLIARELPRTPENTMPTTLESWVAEVFAPAYLEKSATA
jgi:uncharacterized protein YbjT (DUF2867 family)